MKKLLAIVVLGLMWPSVVFSNSLIGKKLECNFSDVMWQYFEFISEDKVQKWLYTGTAKAIKFSPYYYDTSVGFITIYPSKKKDILKKDGMLSRETLRYTEKVLTYKCRIIDVNIDELLEKRFEIDSAKQRKKNKI